MGDFNRIKRRNERVIMYGVLYWTWIGSGIWDVHLGTFIGRALDRATRPVAPTLSPDEYDGNGRIMGNFNITSINHDFSLCLSANITVLSISGINCKQKKLSVHTNKQPFQWTNHYQTFWISHQ